MGMVKVILLTRKQDLMARALVYKDGSYTAKHRDKGDKPPGETDHTDVQTISVPGTREDGTDGSEGG